MEYGADATIKEIGAAEEDVHYTVVVGGCGDNTATGDNNTVSGIGTPGRHANGNQETPPNEMSEVELQAEEEDEERGGIRDELTRPLLRSLPVREGDGDDDTSGWSMAGPVATP